MADRKGQDPRPGKSSRPRRPAPGRPPEGRRRRPLGEPWYDDDLDDPYPAPDPPAESIAIADRLHSAAIHILRRLRREDDASGLTAARLSALSVVVFTPGLRLGDLAAAERVAPPSMSRLVASLERDGLVRRRADPDDARVQLVEATDAGRRLLEEGRRRRVSALARDVAELPPELRRRLERVLDLLDYLAMPDEHPSQLG